MRPPLIRRLFLALLSVLLLPGFATHAFAQDVPTSAPSDVYAADENGTRDDSDPPLMLWTVADDDNTVALLGSIHFARPDFFPLAAPIEAAYDSAEVVVFEIDLSDMQAQAATLAQRGTFTDSTTLADVLPDRLHARALAATEAYGLPEAAVARMEPWLLSLTLTSLDLMSRGYGDGIDQHYYRRAQADAKTLRALETVAFQLDLFDTMPLATQAAFLQSTLDGQDDLEAMMGGMTEAWSTGNAGRLDALLDENFDGAPDLETLLLRDRNAAWVPQIEAFLSGSEDVLVVVGAGHLVGEDSVVAMLRERGHTVTQHGGR